MFVEGRKEELDREVICFEETLATDKGEAGEGCYI